VKVVRERIPHAEIVFDNVHLIRLLLDTVNRVRSADARRLQITWADVLRKTRYVLLKNEGNLTAQQELKLQEL
jgi:transposase